MNPASLMTCRARVLPLTGLAGDGAEACVVLKASLVGTILDISSLWPYVCNGPKFPTSVLNPVREALRSMPQPRH